MNPIYRFTLHTDNNLFDIDNPYNTEGMGMNPTNGQEYDDAQVNLTDVIGTIPYFAFIFNAFVDVCFYDANRNFIQGVAHTNHVIAPNNARYLYVTAGVNDWENLTIIGERNCFPIYRNDVSKEYELQSNEQYYRAKLSGKIGFERNDYDYIDAQPFDTKFGVTIYISYDLGKTWTEYWRGQFWKTNCTFDVDNKYVSLTPEINDRYTAILAGLEKEFDLITLAPQIEPVKYRKRPALQIYMAGQSSIGQCLMGSYVYWESQCEARAVGEYNNEHFGDISDWYPIKLGFSEVAYPTLFQALLSTTLVGETTNINYGDYTLQITPVDVPGESRTYNKLLIRNSDGAQWAETGRTTYTSGQLEAVPGTDADVRYAVYETMASVHIVGRFIFDKEGTQWYDIPTNGMIQNNRNYRYCMPIPEENNNVVVLTGNMSSEPTQYGLYQPGLYYDTPDHSHQWAPIAPNSWGLYSIWLNLDLVRADYETYDNLLMAEMVLKDAFPIASVIDVLLKQIAPDVTFEGTSAYSQFLYGSTSPSWTHQLFITPKSNILTSGYEQPAQTAPITLKQIFDMLRDCFRCFWYIDDENRLRIEHILYFHQGGSYSSTPTVSIDLTQQVNSRNNKPWATDTSKYTFDKPDMPARYQFKWMDAVTKLFDGYPIDIISRYVNAEKIEDVSVNNFTSDIDFMLLSPSEVSQDGFALLAASIRNDEYLVPLIALGVTTELGNRTYTLQNGVLSFQYLQRYYRYDMPAPRYRIFLTDYTAYGVKKLKTQTLNFPLLSDVDLNQNIKTFLGEGTIQKLFINLSSRNANATLVYDTE